MKNQSNLQGSDNSRNASEEAATHDAAAAADEDKRIEDRKKPPPPPASQNEPSSAAEVIRSQKDDDASIHETDRKMPPRRLDCTIETEGVKSYKVDSNASERGTSPSNSNVDDGGPPAGSLLVPSVAASIPTIGEIAYRGGGGEPIPLPRQNDVLFGRGKTHQHRQGNMQMQKLVEEFREEYDNSNRDEKTRIAWSIVKSIQKYGGRFLKFNKEQQVWFEVSDEVARNKVSHAMRDGRNKSLGATAELNSQAAAVFQANNQAMMAAAQLPPSFWFNSWPSAAPPPPMFLGQNPFGLHESLILQQLLSSSQTIARTQDLETAAASLRQQESSPKRAKKEDTSDNNNKKK